MRKKLTFAKAINASIEAAIKKDKKVVLIGLGVDDPKGVLIAHTDVIACLVVG